MLQNILALEDVQELDKKTQKEVTGGLVCACLYFNGEKWVCC
ncbi:hypothetical protein [uncultured Kordia sp.]|nr:hypothetical protein [uncultured Kordia sp.]